MSVFVSTSRQNSLNGSGIDQGEKTVGRPIAQFGLALTASRVGFRRIDVRQPDFHSVQPDRVPIDNTIGAAADMTQRKEALDAGRGKQLVGLDDLVTGRPKEYPEPDNTAHEQPGDSIGPGGKAIGPFALPAGVNGPLRGCLGLRCIVSLSREWMGNSRYQQRRCARSAEAR